MRNQYYQLGEPWLLPQGQTIWIDGQVIDPLVEIRQLRAENERLRSALEELDTKLQVESSFEESGQMFVAFYCVPAGPWHKILGLIR